MNQTKVPGQKNGSWRDWMQSSSPGGKKRISALLLKKNVIPAILGIFVYAFFLNFLLAFQKPLADLLFKFVDFLQIPKVLKLPLLVNPVLYKYSAMIIVGYVAFAFFLDLYRFLDRNLFNDLQWEGSRLKLTRRGWLGGESIHWEPNQSGLQILHKSGVIRKLLGLEKIVFFLQAQGAELSVIAESPYFSSRKNGEFLDRLFHS